MSNMRKKPSSSLTRKPAERTLSNPHASTARAPSSQIKMGSKPLKLGKKLRYPITISQLLKRPGDALSKGDTIFEYTFKWKKEVGDVVTGETWETDMTTTTTFPSSVDGKLVTWDIKPGQVVTGDIKAADVEETCSHSVQYAGLCALCGKDMNETSWATEGVDADRAKINMIHDQTLLSVSKDEASRAEEQLQRRLLDNRKLSLVVDLDQTIIHACIEPTIGEWQRDKSSPNYEAVKDVVKFQLSDDAPRGLASGCWYYIKMRPGLKEFLQHVAEKYELHVYTMGTRAYAQQIAKIVDPEHKLFGDRIISRDENGSLTAKTLSRLFPVDTKMVVIIDDRADVWPRNRSNLIKVVPYDFFVGIGDINSSFLPKREDIAQATPIVPIKTTTDGKAADAEKAADDKDKKVALKLDTIAAPAAGGMNALADLVAMSGGGDEKVLQIQAEEQTHFLEKQLTERPLLHMQEKLEKEVEAEGTEVNGTADGEAKSAAPSPEQHHKHNLLNDDDKELFYLEKHLLDLHKAFYDQYDNAVVHAKGGPVAQLRPGHAKKLDVHSGKADLQLVPDIGEVMPKIKANTLKGTSIVLSGLVPLGIDIIRYLRKHPESIDTLTEPQQWAALALAEAYNNHHRDRSELGMQAMSFGAQIHNKISHKATHLVVSANRTRTQKVRQAARYPGIKIVRQQWLQECMSRWERVDETPYLVRNFDASESVETSHLRDRRFSAAATDFTEAKRVQAAVLAKALSKPLSKIERAHQRRKSQEIKIDTGTLTKKQISVHRDDREPLVASDEDLSEISRDTSGDDTTDAEDGQETDQDADAPSELEDGKSPIEGLQNVDWSELDDELKDFMGESGDDSDDGSVTSRSSDISTGSTSALARWQKLKHGRDSAEPTDDEAESTLSKKQRIARSRTTGLKTVKTLSPEQNAADAEADGGSQNGANGEGEETDDGFGDLEAEMMAEFEKGDWDENGEGGP